jgi:hypothetical protein
MHHDIQVRTLGECACKCHLGGRECTCQLSAKVRAVFCPPIKTAKPGRTKLTSRVQPFTKSRRNVMAFKDHGLHGLRLDRQLP